jgi:uncharacterized protein (DUF1697 family)
MVALLRGVNVGGKTTLPMAELRKIVEECGYADVRTYIQSGNVVLRAVGESPSDVSDRLRTALADTTGREIDVTVRTREQLTAAVDTNPYLDRTEEPTHLHVVFAEASLEGSLDGLDLDGYAPEEATASGRELYLFLPNGMGRSKLAGDLARLDGARGTARNWRTVTKLLAIADELD